MNKHLFVIFLSILSLNLCASDQMYFDYPGQVAPARPLSPQKNRTDLFHCSEFPSQLASSNQTPPPSNGSTPEMERRVDQMTKAIITHLALSGSEKK